MSQTLVKIVGSIIVVVFSFAVTTYLLDWWVAAPSSRPEPTTKLVTGQNLLWPSQDFANASWNRAGIAAIELAIPKSPNGDNTASRLVESTDNGRHFIGTYVDGATPGALDTFSVYFRPGDRAIRFEMGDVPKGKYGTTSCNVGADGTGQVAKSGDVVSGSVEPAGQGWYRCWAAMPFDLSKVVVNIELRGPNGAAGYQGDGHSGVVIWGAQFQTGNKPMAYMQTTTGPIAKAN